MFSFNKNRQQKYTVKVPKHIIPKQSVINQKNLINK